MARHFRRDCIRALKPTGFDQRRQRGSHVILQRTDPAAMVTVPLHKEFRPGALRAIVSQAGLTVEQFMALLDR